MNDHDVKQQLSAIQARLGRIEAGLAEAAYLRAALQPSRHDWRCDKSFVTWVNRIQRAVVNDQTLLSVA